MDYFIKAADEAALHEALLAAGVTNADGQVQSGYSLDIIGTIYEPLGDDVVPLEGFHANLRCLPLSNSQIASLPLIEPPEAPVRVWA